MPAISIDKIYFSPAIAVARLGASPVPMEAFTWAEDPSSFGAGRTVVVPQVSFHVLPDGSIDPYLPGDLQFKDAGMIRPVCPFLEMHALYTRPGEPQQDTTLSPALLEEAGLGLHHLSFNVTAANRKASRHTGNDADSFEARILVLGNDYEKKELLAFTRSTSGTPLVFENKPISLGSFQVIRSKITTQERLEVDLRTIRVRFTPAKGQVYGPPFAVEGQTTDSRSRHMIVPEQNRILNPDSGWARFTLIDGASVPSTPADIYDGESDLYRDFHSWGVVDDTCDAVITATLADCKGGSACVCIVVGPPHYSPDRRPFYSLADEFADRDPGSFSPVGQPDQLSSLVVDLFRRILETASGINVESQRARAIETNAKRLELKSNPALPATDKSTMTLEDKVNGNLFLSQLATESLKSRSGKDSTVSSVLLRPELARAQHEELANPEYLFDFLLKYEDRLRDIIRPPFAWLEELPEKAEERGLQQFRDPRNNRDRAHDMRMPPYLRDSDFSALSITRRQWNLIGDLIENLKKKTPEKGDLPHLSGLAKKISEYHRRKKNVR